ncbi:MAG: patatin-like phospholipase family protein [Clostridia bacterium]|nr:patatin-like phospholipase family protein [Clostridia bacterium]
MILPSQSALVLGGGGAKGAYQIGAISALEEAGITCGHVVGVSIGAINAAMYAQRDMALAGDLWDNIRLSDILTADALSIAEDAEAVFDQPEKLLEYFARNSQKSFSDISPLKVLLARSISEEKVRSSPIRLTLTATRFPTLSCVEKKLADMEPGTLHQWLLASAAIFPIFPMQTIGEERYIDGGFCDNTPVDAAIRAGARRIIAIDVGKNRSHTQYDRRPNITYIRASHPLGGLLDFSSETIARSRILGYNDTMRALGMMRGIRYSFDQIDAQALFSRAQDFVVRLTQIETALSFSNALTKKDSAPLFSLLEEELPSGADAIDYFLRAMELCADVAQVNPAQVFTFRTFTDELRARLPLDKAESMLDSLLGGRIGVLFSQPQPDRKLVISCLYHLLLRENTFSGLALRTLAAFPREMLCALTLQAIL